MGANQKAHHLLGPREIAGLIHGLYANTLGSRRLREFLGECCKLVNATLATVSVSDHQTGRWRYIDHYPDGADVLPAYETRYTDEDPMKAELLRQPGQRFFTSGELGARIEPAALEGWRRWFTGFGYGELVAAHFPLDRHHSCLVCWARADGTGGFSRHDVALLALLLPHIEQAMAIHVHIDRLRIMADLAQEHLAQMGTGCITLDQDKRVNFINHVAREMLREANGMQLREGGIHLDDARSDARFQQLQNTCISTSRLPAVMSGGVVAAARPGKLPLNVVVLPYRNGPPPGTTVTSGSHAIVLVFDPARPRVEPPAVLRELYGLSKSEASVCWRVANGESLDDIAAGEGISKETLRSQLKRVFTKTGTSRQLDLVRLVLIGPAASSYLTDGWADSDP